MSSRIFLYLVVCLIVISGSVMTAADASVLGTTAEITLDRPQLGEAVVVMSGRAGADARVRLMHRTNDGWHRVAVDRADGRGLFEVSFLRPAGRWVVRAVSDGVRSRTRAIARLEPENEPTDDPTTDPVPEPDACGPRVQKADGSWWECSFVDDFDGDALDRTRWIAQETWFSGVTNGTACYVNSPATISVSDGSLKLSAVKLADPFRCASPFGAFTTDRAAATVTTKGRFSQAYGRFEARVKMADTREPGAHSAFWLFPDQLKYGAWPLSGEIDIAEWYSAVPAQVFPSVHYVDGARDVHTGQSGFVRDASDYHTYAVDWTPDEMRFYFDGVLTYTHSWTALAPLVGSQPFDQPFNVVLTQAWGGLWNAPTGATPNTVTMTVDQVRVWK